MGGGRKVGFFGSFVTKGIRGNTLEMNGVRSVSGACRKSQPGCVERWVWEAPGEENGAIWRRKGVKSCGRGSERVHFLRPPLQWIGVVAFLAGVYMIRDVLSTTTERTTAGEGPGGGFW